MVLEHKTTDARRYKRIPFRRPVRVKAAGHDVYEGHLAQDISQGGVRIFTADFVPVHSVVTIQFQLQEQSRIMELLAKVVWVRFNSFAENYQIGLEFMGDKPRECEAIGYFVRSL